MRALRNFPRLPLSASLCVSAIVSDFKRIYAGIEMDTEEELFALIGLPSEAQPLPPIVDPDNPASVTRLIASDAFMNAVQRVPLDFWQRDEEDLAQDFGGASGATETDWALKVALWNSIRRAATGGGSVAPQDVYGGICTYHHWLTRVLANPKRVAWLLSPIQDYQAALEPVLSILAKRAFEIASAPIMDKSGRINVALAKVQMQLRRELEDRKFGAPVQKSLHAHANLGQSGGETPSQGNTQAELARMEEINRRLKELDAEERDALHLPPAEKVT